MIVAKITGNVQSNLDARFADLEAKLAKQAGISQITAAVEAQVLTPTLKLAITSIVNDAIDTAVEDLDIAAKVESAMEDLDLIDDVKVEEIIGNYDFDQLDLSSAISDAIRDADLEDQVTAALPAVMRSEEGRRALIAALRQITLKLEIDDGKI